MKLRSRVVIGGRRAWPFLVPGIVYVLVMFAFPIYDVIRMAFSNVTFANFAGSWKLVGLENFRKLPDIPGWNLMLRNTGIFLVGSIVPQFLIGGLLAVALRETSRMRRLARTFVLLPWLFPTVATASVFLWMFQSPGGIFDSVMKGIGLVHSPPYFLDVPTDALIVIILVNVWVGIPFNYLLIQSGLQAISKDIHEAAIIDGASWLQELLRITVPVLKDTLITVLLVGIMGTMNVFAYVWILTYGGPGDATMLPGLFAYQLAFGEFQYSDGAAVILLIVATLLVVAVAYVLLTGRGNARSKRVRRVSTVLRPPDTVSSPEPGADVLINVGQ